MTRIQKTYSELSPEERAQHDLLQEKQALIHSWNRWVEEQRAACPHPYWDEIAGFTTCTICSEILPTEEGEPVFNWGEAQTLEAPGTAALAAQIDALLERLPEPPEGWVRVAKIQDVGADLPWLVLEYPLDGELLLDFVDWDDAVENGDGPVRVVFRGTLATKKSLERLPEWSP